MAQEIMTTRQLPVTTEAAPEPRSTDEARQAIEATRGRISATLDDLETRLEAKKEAIRDRFDLATPARQRIRQRPWVVVGGALAVGLLLGLASATPDARRRKHDRTLRDQRRRIQQLEEQRAALRAGIERHHREAHGDDHRGDGAADSVLGMIRGALLHAVVGGLQDRVRRGALPGRR
jgi:ElaB/YqjD/DUF883 family membrane-anchored ribosome-binding protein